MLKNISLFCLSFSLLFFLGDAVANEKSFKPSDLRDKGILNVNIIVYSSLDFSISIIGMINNNSVDEFRKILRSNAIVHTIYIDSIGGYVENAIEIANIIKSKKYKLIVDGRCLSACANYIFTAADSKIVLLNSFVGIHEKSFISSNGFFDGRNGKIYESLNFADKKKYKDLHILEDEFYVKEGIRKDLHVAFSKSISSDNSSTSINGRCKNFKIWALSKKQLQSIGVKGMQDFWFPNSIEEKRNLERLYNFKSDDIFFGTENEIISNCKNNSTIAY